MIKIKQLLLTTVLFFTACGTEEHIREIDETRNFDLWQYMTSTLNHEVEYSMYENDKKINYLIETHRVTKNGYGYERIGNSRETILSLKSNSIVMEEKGNLENEISSLIDIQRYVHLGDNKVFKSDSIKNCQIKNFYSTYLNKNIKFYNVLMIDCYSKSGIHQEFYYGYNEGIVAIYEENGLGTKEYIKVDEKRF